MPEAGEIEYLTLAPRPIPAEGASWTVPCSAMLVGGASTTAAAKLTPERVTFGPSTDNTSRILAGDYGWSVTGDELRLESPAVRATFVPAAHDHLLMRRGFRWINERPFNR